MRRFIKWVTNPVTVITLTALLIIPLLYIGRYNHPSSDDFENAVWTNYYQAQVHLYQTWTGRYFSSLVLTLSPYHWHSLTGYRIAAGVLIILFSVCFMMLVEKGLSAYTPAPRRVRIIIAAATLILLLNNLSSLAEGFYWYSGAMTYTLSAILFACFLLIAMALDRKPDAKPSVGRYVSAAILLACTIGSNEIIMVLADAVCFCLLRYYKRKGITGLSRFYLLLCAVCLLCSAAAIWAPGNSVRQAHGDRNFLIAIPSWIYFSKELLLEWISDPFFLLYTVLILHFFRQYRFRETTMSLLAAFLLPVALVYLLSFPGFWALGKMPPARAKNVIYIFFVLSWIFFLLKLSGYLQKVWDGQSSGGAAVRQISGVLIVIVIMADFSMNSLRNANYFILAKNLAKHTAQDYSAEVDKRYALIRSAAGDTVVLPPIQRRRGNILYFSDIGTNPDVFPNSYFAVYWGKSKIYIGRDSSGRAE